MGPSSPPRAIPRAGLLPAAPSDCPAHQRVTSPLRAVTSPGYDVTRGGVESSGQGRGRCAGGGGGVGSEVPTPGAAQARFVPRVGQRRGRRRWSGSVTGGRALSPPPPPECAPPQHMPSPTPHEAVRVGLDTRSRTDTPSPLMDTSNTPVPAAGVQRGPGTHGARLEAAAGSPPDCSRPAGPAPPISSPRPGRYRVIPPGRAGPPSALGSGARGAARGTRGSAARGMCGGAGDTGMGAAEPEECSGGSGGLWCPVLRRDPPGPGKPAEQTIPPVCAHGPGAAGVTVRPSRRPPEPLRGP